MAKKKSLDFEKLMKRLDQIVDELETESTSLEESMKLFEEGIKLTDECRSILGDAESKIKKLLAEE